MNSVNVVVELPESWVELSAHEGNARLLEPIAGCAEQPARSIRGNRVRIKGPCWAYRYPLIAEQGRHAIPDYRRVKVTTSSQWLWLPEIVDGDYVRVTLSLPNGYRASVPWPRDELGYRIESSPRTSKALAIFGDFVTLPIDLPNGRLTAALLPGVLRNADHQKIQRWLTVAATDVFNVYGRFPNPQTQIIVVPVETDFGGGDSPVPFGHVLRYDGEAVRFFVDPKQPLSAFFEDWTATHEFAHLLLPYVSDKWVAEGFASYYQNILLARRGVYSDKQVWSRFYRSFSAAAATPKPPFLNRLEDRSFWDVRMLIYWSGAAAALLADVRLRELSAGEETLDTVLSRLQRCCLPARTRWSAKRFFETLDTLTPYKIFTRLHTELLAHRGLVSLASTYAQLGIIASTDGISLDEDAEGAAIRRALVARTPSKP